VGSGMDRPHLAPAIASGFGLNEVDSSAILLYRRKRIARRTHWRSRRAITLPPLGIRFRADPRSSRCS